MGLVLLILFPGAGRRNADALRRSPWASLGLGTLVLVLTPLLALAIFGVGVWVGGWWVALPLLAAYLLWLLVGYLVSAVAVGSELLARAPRQVRSPIWSLLLGLLLLALLQLIPFVGGLIGLAAVLFGSGALLLAVRAARTPPPSALSRQVSPSFAPAPSPLTTAAP